MPKTTRSYRSWQLDKLSDPERAASYLNAALQESPKVFKSALAKVAQANQMSKVAKEAGVQRESLYRSLSDQGNPTLETLRGVLGAVGLHLAVTPLVHEPETVNERIPNLSAKGHKADRGNRLFLSFLPHFCYKYIGPYKGLTVPRLFYQKPYLFQTAGF